MNENIELGKQYLHTEDRKKTITEKTIMRSLKTGQTMWERREKTDSTWESTESDQRLLYLPEEARFGSLATIKALTPRLSPLIWVLAGCTSHFVVRRQKVDCSGQTRSGHKEPKKKTEKKSFCWTPTYPLLTPLPNTFFGTSGKLTFFFLPHFHQKIMIFPLWNNQRKKLTLKKKKILPTYPTKHTG